jgi:hypothetical protein
MSRAEQRQERDRAALAEAWTDFDHKATALLDFLIEVRDFTPRDLEEVNALASEARNLWGCNLTLQKLARKVASHKP